MTGAIHAGLLDVRAEVMALADCLERLAPCRGTGGDTPRGLSLMAWHIAGDINNVLRKIENLDGELRGHSCG
jgi:hypothetical protein